ncbi:aldo/keto reductase [Leptospira perolatii]|uniref:Aldo/keto reductase n=1 Tax=Leptospira perolatii TaxID=2023191 RepID=A0A2M9ZHV3_9LEPT|nr:aldo/keto reductase [Leptospira perolatii]PJZ68007.1 aldo/keto reductase [Leptospira perolatii]PJZ71638.1 aldo/keto reductase [Leptospira perolatii]
MTTQSINQSVTLNNGIQMPILGLGVWKTQSGKECKNAVKSALNVGYRHIDTAKIYGNEEDVGTAIKESGIPRESIFITTKLWNGDQNDARASLEASLKRMDLDKIDLYLIHFPVRKTMKQAWKELEKAYEDGLARSIGVSNYTTDHLKELFSYANVIPAVNQVEYHPFLNQTELLELCKTNKIQLEAYSPLAHGKKIDEPKLASLSKKYGKTPAQILIRWCVDKDLVVIPKSVREERIKENSEVFDFSLQPEDMRLMESWNENFRTCWDPTGV